MSTTSEDQHTSTDVLCERCAALKLDEAVESFDPLRLDHPNRYPVVHESDLHVAASITRSSLGTNSPCSLCRLFAWASGDDSNFIHSHRNEGLKLYKFREQLFDGLIQTDVFRLDDDSHSIDDGSIDIYGTDRWIYPIPQNPNQRTFDLEESPVADLQLLGEWIRKCNEDHQICSSVTHSRKEPLSLSLIDCEVRCVRPIFTSEKYTALSYVWGDTVAERASDTGSLPSHLPQVIEDAMTVTRRIGLRYLWVDRYCIPQHDKAARHEQIRRMDDIFHGAEITVIALGDDPSFGLPGINGTPRELPLCVRIGDYKFAPYYRGINRNYFDDSKWRTRAWTLQEGILSRRVVWFSKQEMTFECSKMSRSDANTIKSSQFQDQGFQWHNLQQYGFVVVCEEFTLRNLWKTIRDYSTRDMSYQEDALNAFMGILHRAESSASCIQNYYGQPFPLHDTQISGTSSQLKIVRGSKIEQPSAEFIHSLQWRCALLGSRRSERPPFRRAGFPSWSWLGWGNTMATKDDLGEVESDYLSDIWVETSSGDCPSFEDFIESGKLDIASLNASPVIHLYAWTTPIIRARSLGIDPLDGLRVEREATHGQILLGEGNSSTNTPFLAQPHSWHAVLLNTTVSASHTALIVESKGIEDVTAGPVLRVAPLSAEERAYKAGERVGSIWVSDYPRKVHAAEGVILQTLDKINMTQIPWKKRLVHLK